MLRWVAVSVRCELCGVWCVVCDVECGGVWWCGVGYVVCDVVVYVVWCCCVRCVVFLYAVCSVLSVGCV